MYKFLDLTLIFAHRHEEGERIKNHIVKAFTKIYECIWQTEQKSIDSMCLMSRDSVPSLQFTFYIENGLIVIFQDFPTNNNECVYLCAC